MKLLYMEDDANASLIMERLLFLEEDSNAQLFSERLDIEDFAYDIVSNPASALDCLMADDNYNAIILDLDLEPDSYLDFGDNELAEKLLKQGMFSGYIFYKAIICERFPSLERRTIFYTAYVEKFKAQLANEPNEFARLKDRIYDKRDNSSGDAVLAWLHELCEKPI